MSPTRVLPREDLDDLLEHLSPMANELSEAAILLTGGTGFFGTWLLAPLLQLDEAFGLRLRVFVLTRDEMGYRKRMPDLAGHPAVRLLSGDIRSFTLPEPVTHVVHGATTPSDTLNREHPLEMASTIVDGTRHLMEELQGSPLRKVLYISSGAVYGPQPPECPALPEDWPGGPDPMAPEAAYGNGKRFAEHLCRLEHHCHGVPVAVARCFAFFGPHQALGGHQAAPAFLADALAGRPIHVSGDGTPIRSWMHGKDLSIWLWTLLLRGAAGRAYNVGSCLPCTIQQLAELVAELSGSSVRIESCTIPGIPPSRYLPDTSRARMELGLAETMSLRQGLEQTLAWHRIRHSS